MKGERPLPESLTAGEKKSYEYGWRRGAVGSSLDQAEAAWMRKSPGHTHAEFMAFHDGYEDRAIGRGFGARPYGEAED